METEFFQNSNYAPQPKELIINSDALHLTLLNESSFGQDMLTIYWIFKKFWLPTNLFIIIHYKYAEKSPAQ